MIDLTYGKGAWWGIVRPANLTPVDIEVHPDAPDPQRVIVRDATHLWPEWADWFDVAAVDPPYKLNGTDQGEGRRYGVHEYGSVAARHSLAYRLLAEGHRVTKPGGRVLYKCMAQVNGGRLRWQNYEAYGWATEMGMTLVEELGVIGGRPQPERHRWYCYACGRENVGPRHACKLVEHWDEHRTDNQPPASERPWLERRPSPQEHAYRRPSVLMVFRKATR